MKMALNLFRVPGVERLEINLNELVNEVEKELQISRSRNL